MSSGHFADNAFDYIVKVELVVFFRDARMKNDVEQQVAEFLFQVTGVATLDGIQGLVCFLQRISRY